MSDYEQQAVEKLRAQIQGKAPVPASEQQTQPANLVDRAKDPVPQPDQEAE